MDRARTDKRINKIRVYYHGYTTVERLLLFATVVFVGWHIICNLFFMRGAAEADIAKTMVHTVEMAKHRTLYLHDWDYWTNAEWDFSAAPAVLFYMLTKDVFLSYGIVNIINIFLWWAVLYFLFRHMEIPRTYRLLLYAILFCSYDWGGASTVWYTADMLFYGVAWYVYRVLIPLLFIVILTTAGEVQCSWRNRAGFLMLLLLVFATGASSGTYVFLCGLLPVIICFFLFTVLERHFDRYAAMVTASVAIATLAGVFICNHLEISPNSDSMMIKSASEVQDALFKTFFTLLEVWHLFPKTPTAVMSVDGIAELIKLVFVGIILCFGLMCLKFVFGLSRLHAEDKGTIPTSEKIRIALISVFAWNYMILFLTRATARYQLIGAIPLVICAGSEIHRYTEKITSRTIRMAIPLLAGICMMLITANSAVYTVNRRAHDADGVIAFGEELKDVLESEGVNTVYLLNASELCEMLRLYDDDRLYVSIDVNDMTGVNRIYYYGAHDRIAGEDRNAIVAFPSTYERTPSYVRDHYKMLEDTYAVDAHFHKYLEEVEEYGIWVADENPIDGIAGIPSYGDGIDLPCSPGYRYKGEIDGAGHLHTVETGCVMESVLFEIIPYGYYRIEIDCVANTNTAVEVILMRGEEIYAVLPRKATGVYEIDLVQTGSYRLQIIKLNDEELEVGEIRFIHQETGQR